jgi:hypothetical protein
MARVAEILAGTLLLSQSAFAQTPPSTAEPYSFLPSDIRREYRAEILGSAWMQKVHSAAGWVIVQETRSEGLGQPYTSGSNRSCLDRSRL